MLEVADGRAFGEELRVGEDGESAARLGRRKDLLDTLRRPHGHSRLFHHDRMAAGILGDEAGTGLNIL